MADYRVSDLPLCNGKLGLGPIPGRNGSYQADLSALLRWQPDLVLTMTLGEELSYVGAGRFGPDLEAAGVAWCHLPIGDMNAPAPPIQDLWVSVSLDAHRILNDGGRVFTHCFGGCGRAGMAALRLMVEAGEQPEAALERLRGVRPCAVETDAQAYWASLPSRVE